jgi:hypothetical protein
MNDHADYFLGVWDAHYTAFFVYLAHLFDRRKDSSSIPTYLGLLDNKFGRAEVQELRDEFEVIARRAEPLLKARHKTVAHVDARLTEKDIFAEVDITWNEVKVVLAQTIQFVAKLRGSSDPSELGVPRDGRLRDATFKVLRKLGEA